MAMKQRYRTGPLFTRWLIVAIFLFWIMIGLIFTVMTHQVYLGYPGMESLTLFDVMVIALPQWIGWAFFSFVIFAVSDRFPLDQPPLWRNLLLHIALLVIWIFVHLTLDFFWQAWVTPIPLENSYMQTWLKFLMRKVHLYLLLYPALVGVQHALAYYRHTRFQAVQQSQLREQLTNAQLQTLRVQLQPHFLFNTLHGVSSLMYENLDAADEMLTKLSDFLRAALREDIEPIVSLDREIGLVDLYLAIEAVRFRDRLVIEKSIDTSALGCSVPVFLLQPLAENAIRHGIEKKRGPGRLHIRAGLEREHLVMFIDDDGAGLGGGNLREGMGLRNTRERLKLLYGKSAGVTLSTRDHGGTSVKVWLPADRSGNCV